MDIREGVRRMGRKPVRPIGTCFDSVADWVAWRPNPPEDFRICHGIGISNFPGIEGKEIGHAWLEWSGRAFDTTWGLRLSAESYRRQLKLRYCVEYRRPEFIEHWLKHDFTGPWDPIISKVVDRLEKELGQGEG